MNHPGTIVNRRLPKLARLSETTLLERVAAVEQIRTCGTTISLFISTAQRMVQLERLHAAVHNEAFDARIPGFNLATNSVPFVLELPQPLHYWLAAHSLDEVKAQIANWMAALYASHTRRDNMWSKWRSEIKHLANTRYSPYIARQAAQLADVWKREYDHARLRYHGRASTEVLRNPFAENERPFLDHEDVLRSFRFKVRIGYFRDDDWVCIVERSLPKLTKMFPSRGVLMNKSELKRAETDTLVRAESNPELWQAWLRAFSVAGSPLRTVNQPLLLAE